MTMLSHLSETRLEQLRADAPQNLDRYRGQGFTDLTSERGWAIDLARQIDISRLAELDGSDNRAETDLKNSILVARILGDLTPSLANEERVWARLSHVEAFEYSRQRWIKPGMDDDTVKNMVRIHFFSPTQTATRDDQAVARLWWNGFIAKHCYPQDLERGLQLLLSSADVRANLVERFWLTGRRSLARRVFHAIDSNPFVLSSEASFREFMKALNVRGAGVVFEAMQDTAIDDILARCSDDAEAILTA